MTSDSIAHPELARILDVFPERSLTIRERFLRDERFRDICRDYAMARGALARFEALPDASSRPEPADYRTIISELEKEISALLSDDPKQARPLRPTQ